MNRHNSKLTIFTLGLIIIIHHSSFIIHYPAHAVSPTVTPKLTPTPTLSKKISITPVSSPSAPLTPTSAEDEKARDLLDSVKATVVQERINQIKEKVEKKAYVGIITEITDSTLTLTNFRGKQRVRILEETTIISTNKKEITVKDLAVDDKVIALGEPDTNETLEAKRVIVVAQPKTVTPKRLIFFGTISEINSKTTSLTLTKVKNPEQTLLVKIDKTTYLVNQKDLKVVLKFTSFSVEQKVIIVYPESSENKTPIAKTIFLLP